MQRKSRIENLCSPKSIYIGNRKSNAKMESEKRVSQRQSFQSLTDQAKSDIKDI